MTTDNRKNIAIVGTGISGLAAAYILTPHHNITVYEKNAYLGGHSRTVEVKTGDGMIPVDTGFIVFNHRNYPLLTGLFSHLNVPVSKSDMSFGVSINHGWMEYGTRRLTDIFAQKRNLLRPAFWRMLSDILRFNRQAGQFLEADASVTLGQCLDEMHMKDWFRQYYLLAMGGAIWSTPLSEMLAFPAASFVRFFDNHGLLTVSDQPQWYTVQGGSREYVKRISASFYDRVKIDTGVVKVVRGAQSVTVTNSRGDSTSYDDVIFACHADQALKLIDSPTTNETRILSAFKYQPNRAVLHSDTSFMPKRKNAWASWVYLSEDRHDKNGCVSLSYWMNNLQPLGTDTPLIVTLNPGREPDPKLVHDNHWFDHPLFNAEAINAQKQLDTIQGAERLWFCGAYQRYGFHEDGLGSAVAMAKLMGVEKPWK